MNNWDLRVALRDKLWPLDPGHCRRCGWPIGKRKGCSEEVCRAVLPYDSYRYDNPPDIEIHHVYEYMLAWLRTNSYRYVVIWTGEKYLFMLMDSGSLSIKTENASLGIAIAEAILELP